MAISQSSSPIWAEHLFLMYCRVGEEAVVGLDITEGIRIADGKV